jgi:hypothetical protein
MTDVQLFIEEPDVRLNTYTASLQRGEERDLTPVVIVRMAVDSNDFARAIGWPVRGVTLDVIGDAMLPDTRGTVIFVREER